MLAGIYYGAQYGGSTTAILVNLPGESSSVVTVIDGYQMARQGRAGPGAGGGRPGLVLRRLRRHADPGGVRAAADRTGLQVRPGRVLLADGPGPDRRRGAGVAARCSRRSRMIVLGLLLGLVGTDVNSGVARFSLRHPGTDRRHRLRRDRHGRVRLRRDHHQPVAARRRARGVHRQGARACCPTKEDFKHMMPAVLRGTALGSALGILPGGGALLAAFAAYTIEKKTKLQPGRSAVRQGQHPRRGGARVGQQRRRADLLHPAADAGHSAQRRDGADGRRDDHPQHPAGPAGDDQQPGAVLGPDRLDVDRQRDAGRS